MKNHYQRQVFRLYNDDTIEGASTYLSSATVDYQSP